MKGMVFVELLRMAEAALGEDVVDQVLEACELESGGAYSAVGNYPCSELVTLVCAFSEHSGASVHDLQFQFGRWMLDRFVQTYPAFFEDKPDALAMLEAIDQEVHVEVRKLYPDAELPTFATDRIAAGTLAMTYRSPRPLVPFCHGLIDACLTHFDQSADVAIEDRSADGASEAVFTVTLAEAA